MHVGFLEWGKRGEELYRLLDDGTDFSGIFIYMQQDKWSSLFVGTNISYAIGVTAKEARVREQEGASLLHGERWNPVLDDFIENLKEISVDLYHHVESCKIFHQ